jgi:hypothetical protein
MSLAGKYPSILIINRFFEDLFRLLASNLTIFRNLLKILTGFFAGTFGIQPVILPKAPVHHTLMAGSPRTLDRTDCLLGS